MKAGFDEIAQYYDHIFSFTQTGWLLRKQVWDYLEGIIDDNRALKVIEFGGGTGEDAIFLSRKNHQILCTDISGGMLDTARSKLEEMNEELSVSFQVIDINDIDKRAIGDEYDMILVNFGVFNNVAFENMKRVSEDLSLLLKSGGHLVATVMPPGCFWESLYFLLRLNVGKAVRRWLHNPAYINIGTQQIPTWYYTPERFYGYFSANFYLNTIKPVGFFIPPSYMEAYLGHKKKALQKLESFEKRYANNAFAGRHADYFLIHLVKK